MNDRNGGTSRDFRVVNGFSQHYLCCCCFCNPLSSIRAIASANNLCLNDAGPVCAADFSPALRRLVPARLKQRRRMFKLRNPQLALESLHALKWCLTAVYPHFGRAGPTSIEAKASRDKHRPHVAQFCLPYSKKLKSLAAP